MIIDFDEDDWLLPLERALGDIITPQLRSKLQQGTFRYMEDALELFENFGSHEAAVRLTLDWVKANTVRVFHGTRLTSPEAIAMKADGMRPLDIRQRIKWLRERFPEIDQALSKEDVEAALRKGDLMCRDKQVHAAISSKEMLSGYDYLGRGSEFDRRLLEYAGRADLVPLLTSRGTPRLVKLLFPGKEALAHMHFFFPMEQTMERNGGYPIFVRELLTHLVWRIHDPNETRPPEDLCLHIRQPVVGAYVEDVVEYLGFKVPEDV